VLRPHVCGCGVPGGRLLRRAKLKSQNAGRDALRGFKAGRAFPAREAAKQCRASRRSPLRRRSTLSNSWRIGPGEAPRPWPFTTCATALDQPSGPPGGALSLRAAHGQWRPRQLVLVLLPSGGSAVSLTDLPRRGHSLYAATLVTSGVG
jgi:hypothetical protein